MLGSECKSGRLGKLETPGMADELPKAIVTSEEVFREPEHHLARHGPYRAAHEPSRAAEIDLCSANLRVGQLAKLRVTVDGQGQEQNWRRLRNTSVALA
jgi:hypothetical protein